MCLLVSRLVWVLFSVYLQLWIMSFVENGVLASKADSERIYMLVVVTSLVCTAVTSPIFGIFADTAGPRVIVPVSFLLRGFIAACFAFIERPDEIHSFILCILLIVVSII